MMQGQAMLSFVPLHLSGLDRHPGVLQWVQLWLLPSQSLHPLSPLEWFDLGHGITSWETTLDGLPSPVSSLSDTVFLWSPPPAAANIAVEQLSFSRLKRPHLPHIMIVPRLMTHLWRKQLFKIADLVFTLPAGFRDAVWPYYV
jgi:hypothetical protein